MVLTLSVIIVVRGAKVPQPAALQSLLRFATQARRTITPSVVSQSYTDQVV